MRGRILATVLATVGLMPGPAAGQSASPRTPWGHPDLQGAWNFSTITPLERPDEWAAREALTDEEVAKLNAETAEGTDRRPDQRERDVSGAYNAFWWDRGASDGRTSLIVDPPDGRLPPLTAEARARPARPGRGTDTWTDRTLAERCVHHTKVGPPMRSGGYNNNFQLVQSPGYVALLNEAMPHVRIIPLDGGPHIPSTIRKWVGDSRGRWEGDTLVVETTNFNEETRYQGATEHMHLVERFTRVDADTMEYRFTVTDPTTWTKPWTAVMILGRTEGVYEFACHEGNYGMSNTLAGARALERASGSASAR